MFAMYLKSNMDRFIVIFVGRLGDKLGNLKSNMDRFIVSDLECTIVLNFI